MRETLNQNWVPVIKYHVMEDAAPWHIAQNLLCKYITHF